MSAPTPTSSRANQAYLAESFPPVFDTESKPKASSTAAPAHQIDEAAAALKKEQHRMESSSNNPLAPWMTEFLRTMPPLPADLNSNSRPEEAVTTHMELEFKTIDFKNKVIDASVEYQYHNKTHAGKIVLDADSLNIKSIWVNGTLLKQSEEWSLKKTSEHLSSSLEINIPSDKAAGTIKIDYETSPKAKGLYWRDPEFTDGKSSPMLFTQAQPNDGASFVPGQHSPQVRVTYNVKINTGDPKLMAVGSSLNNAVRPSSDGRYTLNMPHRIPKYLLGIAVGEFSCHEYDERTGVYAEGCKLKEAAEKFKQLPEFLKKAEDILGPYMWKTYRPILLTLAYPFGAMEHPCASFLGGDCIDRIFVLIHELTHSWLGNWVTNSTWEEFFFNEGFTSHIESRITTACISEDYALMNIQSNLESARKEMEAIKKAAADSNTPALLNDLRLCKSHVEGTVEISSIPYGKGQMFFMMLEHALGRDKFDAFVKDYINVFALKSMGKERFLEFLKQWLANNNVTKDFDKFKQDHKIMDWLEGFEFPENCPKINSPLLQKIRDTAAKAINGEDVSAEYKTFDAPQRIAFLKSLNGKIDLAQLQKLDKSLNITADEKRFVILSSWAPLLAATNYLTPETEALIQNFVTKRNSQYYTATIVKSLLQNAQGRKLVEKIILEGDKFLDPSVKKIVTDALAKAATV